jgi:outer membrane receptor protein involved in Fe transport
LRADWFVSENEVIAASLFYKYFIDPIERGSISPGNQDVTFRNADAGYDYGVELEGRVSFGRIHQALEMFSINANLALIQSRVTLDEAQAAVAPGQRRPMFGQSPYVANVSLRFDEPDAGVSVTVAYNVYGRRISDVGVRGGGLDGSPSSVTPDMYEEAFHSLDVVGAWELSEHVMLRLTGRNLANAQRRWKQGSIVVEQFRPGVEASVGATFTY